MKRLFLLGLCLTIAFASPGCGNGTRSSSGGLPVASSSPSPAEISSSDQVVKVYSHFIPRSTSTLGNVELVISPGFHINANPATFPYLIATEVQPGKADGILVSDEIVYPSPVLKKFQFAEKPLAVYEGQVVIPIPFSKVAGASGQRLLPIKVRVQACDNEKCYPPATLDSSISIDLDLLHP
jgi:hypothetical protein